MTTPVQRQLLEGRLLEALESSPDETNFHNVLRVAATIGGHNGDWDAFRDNIECPCGRTFSDERGYAEYRYQVHFYEAGVAVLIDRRFVEERAGGAMYIMAIRGFEGSWALLDEVTRNTVSPDLVMY